MLVYKIPDIRNVEQHYSVHYARNTQARPTVRRNIGLKTSCCPQPFDAPGRKPPFRWRRSPSSLPDHLHWQTRLALEVNGFALPEGLRQIYDLISTPDFMAESCMPPVAFRANSAQTLSFPSLRIQLFAARRNPASFVVFCMNDMPAAGHNLCHCRNRQFATVGRPGRLAPSKGRASSSAARRI